MRILPPLFVHEANGQYVEEIQKIFYGESSALEEGRQV
jgi:tRNA1(Val) A37 N6-methylase TrmN6